MNSPFNFHHFKKPILTHPDTLISTFPEISWLFYAGTQSENAVWQTLADIQILYRKKTPYSMQKDNARTLSSAIHTLLIQTILKDQSPHQSAHSKTGINQAEIIEVLLWLVIMHEVIKLPKYRQLHFKGITRPLNVWKALKQILWSRADFFPTYQRMTSFQQTFIEHILEIIPGLEALIQGYKLDTFQCLVKTGEEFCRHFAGLICIFTNNRYRLPSYIQRILNILHLTNEKISFDSQEQNLKRIFFRLFEQQIIVYAPHQFHSHFGVFFLLRYWSGTLDKCFDNIFSQAFATTPYQYRRILNTCWNNLFNFIDNQLYIENIDLLFAHLLAPLQSTPKRDLKKKKIMPLLIHQVKQCIILFARILHLSFFQKQHSHFQQYNLRRKQLFIVNIDNIIKTIRNYPLSHLISNKQLLSISYVSNHQYHNYISGLRKRIHRKTIIHLEEKSSDEYDHNNEYLLSLLNNTKHVKITSVHQLKL